MAGKWGRRGDRAPEEMWGLSRQRSAWLLVHGIVMDME